MLLKLALVLVTVCAISAQILPPLGFRRLRPGPVIETDLGPVQGRDETYDLFRRIYTFKGIRYAQAPVGDLRFRQGVVPIPSPELHQAWEYGSECPQFSILLNRLTGDEDCLFLNIATPRNIRSRLPVVVAIHGGGLHFGNGEMSLLGPELMLQENIIFVSFNYRLNVLGFLNTNDAHAPGNYGLKDMIMVLQWIQRNIENFGGNPDDVTISKHLRQLNLTRLIKSLSQWEFLVVPWLCMHWSFRLLPEASSTRHCPSLVLCSTTGHLTAVQHRTITCCEPTFNFHKI